METNENTILIKEGNIWLRIFYKGLGYSIAEDNDDLRALALTMRGIFKDKLKEAEQGIDEEKIKKPKTDVVDNVYNAGLEKAKQILNDCFGAGK